MADENDRHARCWAPLVFYGVAIRRGTMDGGVHCNVVIGTDETHKLFAGASEGLKQLTPRCLESPSGSSQIFVGRLIIK
jgi:hypothetical protein